MKNKRSLILKDNGKKKQQETFQKYRFVTEYEPSFPDIRKAFRKFLYLGFIKISYLYNLHQKILTRVDMQT